MKSIEELRAEHAKAEAALRAQLALAEAATVTPARVQLTATGAPWLIYEAPSLAAALDIMAAAPIVPFWKYKGTFTKLQPEAIAKEKDGEIAGGPYAASLDISQGAGFGPGAELEFYVMAGETLCKAIVKLQPGPGPACFPQWGAACREERAGLHGRGRIIRRHWSANQTLYALSDDRLHWGGGGDDSAHFEYLWMADYEDGGSDHAAAQLRTLAGEG